jgi:hypothetical protein
MLTEIYNAAVQFRAKGIEKVLFLDVKGAVGASFVNAAEDQKYRGFRYGLTSATGGDGRHGDGTRWLPAEQMEGAVLLGWNPSFDIAQAQGYELLPPSAGRCKALLESAGFEIHPDYCCQLLDALTVCNRFWFIEAALERSGGTAVSLPTFISGAEALRSSYKSTLAFPVRFGPGKHDGPSVYREARWFPECQCFRYTSGFKPMP